MMNNLELSGKTKKCKQCGIIFPVEWFAQNHGANFHLLVNGKTYYKNICPMCNQTAKDKKKHTNRAVDKARRIIYSHGKKFDGKWGINSGRDLVNNFGWGISQLAHDINHAFNNGCSYCHMLYRNMEHGLRNLTLDVVNPDQPPYYATNTKLCCATCNSIKGQRGASAFGLHLAMVQRWKEAKPGSIYNPQYELRLN